MVDAAAINCLTTSTTIEALTTCLVGYTVPSGFYNSGGVGGLSGYTTAQPTSSERTAWSTAVNNLLNINGDCPTTPVDVPGLGGTYTMARFTESSDGRAFCVISEKNTFAGTTNVFARGWGFVIATANNADHLRALHFSAPHPIYDQTTPTQASALFKRVNAKSLVVAGRHRQASSESSACATPSNASDTYYRTDPSHDDDEPFHDALVATRDWQNNNGGCPNDRCAYIQFHRKTSCPTYDIFLSSGPGNGAASHEWYHGTTVRPVRRLKEALDANLPPLAGTLHGLPSTANDCQLTATKNVFGRIVNGRIPPTHCSNDATLASVTGSFIHVEQSDPIVLADYYDEWTNALVSAFPTL
ncbi:hypothetical protein FA15DRAFT_672144 [Coprinopsis marcescibilis]|uniref:Uncharacterized protein n=1 Tax=Coprinopsis marcescibilis TaxID=230819 RepID=A0A5C3KN61_COPMA|nr:hypothetical protein FA15DRAFT_672144 [Coprinopsis marcescibilis]